MLKIHISFNFVFFSVFLSLLWTCSTRKLCLVTQAWDLCYYYHHIYNYEICTDCNIINSGKNTVGKKNLMHTVLKSGSLSPISSRKTQCEKKKRAVQCFFHILFCLMCMPTKTGKKKRAKRIRNNKIKQNND